MRQHWAEPVLWPMRARDERVPSPTPEDAAASRAVRGDSEGRGVRVFVVDDNEIFLLGITRLIASRAGFVVVGQSTSAAEAARLVAPADPDVVIMEARLRDGSGTDLCGAIRRARPDTRCLIFTSDERAETVAAGMAAGASGYILKRVPGETFLDSVGRVSRGEDLLPPPARRASVAPAGGRLGLLATGPSLTLREHQVLGLISDGMTNKQIGESLFLAEKTVKNYVSGLLSKLGFERRTQAAVYGATRERA